MKPTQKFFPGALAVLSCVLYGYSLIASSQKQPGSEGTLCCRCCTSSLHASYSCFPSEIARGLYSMTFASGMELFSRGADFVIEVIWQIRTQERPQPCHRSTKVGEIPSLKEFSFVFFQSDATHQPLIFSRRTGFLELLGGGDQKTKTKNGHRLPLRLYRLMLCATLLAPHATSANVT